MLLTYTHTHTPPQTVHKDIITKKIEIHFLFVSGKLSCSGYLLKTIKLQLIIKGFTVIYLPKCLQFNPLLSTSGFRHLPFEV